MIGEKLGPFRIDSKLGAGAMGGVYKGVYEPNGQVFAVKVIVDEQIQKNKAAERRFQRESDILKHFNHPNIVRHFGVGRSKNTRYYAMEFIDGPTLEAVLEKREQLSWQEVVALGIQICAALHYAHERGVVHRDLKPSNLMISGKSLLKLTDFGIAKDLDATALTAEGRTLGTAAYMAPEQVRGTPEISHKTDLYALGCLLYQMLTGQTPYKGGSAVVLMHQHVTEPIPRPSAKNPDMPVALDELVMRLMAKSPKDRPWDAAAVEVELTELRDRVDRGEPVPMAYGTSPANPTRLGGTSGDPDASLESWSTAVRTGKPKAKMRSGALRRTWMEPALLAAAGVVVLGVIVYLLWPPSASYLIQHARVLMNSARAADWSEAEREYLSELDRRFPNLYRDEIATFRDKVALDKARRRADVLEKPNLGRLSVPKEGVEAHFVEIFNETTAASKAGNDLDAIRKWQGWASSLKPDDPADRPWIALAHERADELTKVIAKRRAVVVEMLDQADLLVRLGRDDEAAHVRQDVTKRFGKYQDLHPLLGSRVNFRPEDAKDAAPETSAKPDP